MALIVSGVEPLDEIPSRRETLHVGPDRTLLFDRLPRAWRHRGSILAALAFGVMGGAGGVWLWNDRSPEPVETPSPPAAAGPTEVRLVLTGVAGGSGTKSRHDAQGASAMRLDAVLLHGRGPDSATVTRVHRVGEALTIRAGELPVTLSVNHPFERVRLQISPRDCTLATQWTPSAQPFTLTWEDVHGAVHTGLGGDHDAQTAIALTRYLDAVCEGVP